MEENKEIKIRLSTVIYLLIIVALVIALGVTYYWGFGVDEREGVNNDKTTNFTENVISNVANENKTEDIFKKVKVSIEKYLEIRGSCGASPLYMLEDLGLADREDFEEYDSVTLDTTSYYNEYTYNKTDVKYDDFETEMLKYMTKDCMRDEFLQYVQEIDGMLYVVSTGGSGIYYTIESLDLKSQNNNNYTYTGKASIRQDDSPEKILNDLTVEIIKQNDNYVVDKLVFNED